MLKIFLVAVGGAFGSVLRYGMQHAVQRASGGSFPAGTFAVNILGCLIIGVLAAWTAGPARLREEFRLGLMVGAVGGFTPFSAFGLETFELARDRQLGVALANVVLSCALGVAAVWLGFRVGQRWFAA